jgi:hypothetical protein
MLLLLQQLALLLTAAVQGAHNFVLTNITAIAVVYAAYFD